MVKSELYLFVMLCSCSLNGCFILLCYFGGEKFGCLFIYIELSRLNASAVCVASKPKAWRSIENTVG